jgi:hypothetical protein
MATCEICGTAFDDLGVQVVLPGLAKSFDRIDCAVRARNLAGASGAGVPSRGMLVPLAAGTATRSFALGGLSAGLAAALAGTRARVALGGATVGVALLVATTAHLATRGGPTADATTRPQALAPQARYAADYADRIRVSAATQTAAQTRSASEVRYTLLAASRSSDVPRAARVMTVATRTHRPKAVRHAGQTQTANPSKSSGARASTRSGWGHGDKNHSHSGPGKSSKAKNHKKK